MVALVDGESVSAMPECEAEKIRFFGIDRPKKIDDFGKRAKGFAFGVVFGRLQV